MHDVKKEVKEGDCQGCCQGLCDIHDLSQISKTLRLKRKAETQIKQEPQEYKQLRCGNCTAQLTCWISENQPKKVQDQSTQTESRSVIRQKNKNKTYSYVLYTTTFVPNP